MNKRNQLLVALAAVAAPALFFGCASIIDGGPKSISIASHPPGAKVTIYNKAGQQVSVQNTPFVVALERSRGYFKGEEYRLQFEAPGYKRMETQLTSTVGGWYWGNLVFGGLIGMLIVDPLTGAMWRLTPDKVEQKLTEDQFTLLHSGNALLVVLKSQATENEQRFMQRLGTAQPVL